MDADSIIPLHYEAFWFAIGGLCVMGSQDLAIIVLGLLLFGGMLVSVGYHYQDWQDSDERAGDW